MILEESAFESASAKRLSFDPQTRNSDPSVTFARLAISFVEQPWYPFDAKHRIALATIFSLILEAMLCPAILARKAASGLCFTGLYDPGLRRARVAGFGSSRTRFGLQSHRQYHFR